MKEANKIGLWLIELNIDECNGIVRCSHNTKETLITALSLVREINGINVILTPFKTAGTIRSLKNKIKKNSL